MNNWLPIMFKQTSNAITADRGKNWNKTLHKVKGIKIRMRDYQSPSQRKPQRTENPRTMSHTMWRRRKACPDTRPLPPLPTWHGPRLATRAPAHAASGQPHQYVVPSSAQTGSGRKQVMGQEAGPPSDLAAQGSAATPSDRVAEGRRKRRRRTAEAKGEVAMGWRKEDESLVTWAKSWDLGRRREKKVLCLSFLGSSLARCIAVLFLSCPVFFGGALLLAVCGTRGCWAGNGGWGNRWRGG